MASSASLSVRVDDSGDKRILVADDIRTDRSLLARWLERWGHEPVQCEDGAAVWRLVESGDAPNLMILDWMMPKVDGVELCRRIRARGAEKAPYILLLTSVTTDGALAEALQAGANDFINKPFDPVVLEARIRNATRILDLQDRLRERVSELEEALARVKRLQGLLPICSYCKRVRSDENYWDQVEAYISEHSDMRFTHSICPACYDEVVEPQLEALEADLAREGGSGGQE